jgi:hypothetical protein
MRGHIHSRYEQWKDASLIQTVTSGGMKIIIPRICRPSSRTFQPELKLSWGFAKYESEASDDISVLLADTMQWLQ